MRWKRRFISRPGWPRLEVVKRAHLPVVMLPAIIAFREWAICNPSANFHWARLDQSRRPLYFAKEEAMVSNNSSAFLKTWKAGRKYSFMGRVPTVLLAAPTGMVWGRLFTGSHHCIFPRKVNFPAPL